MDETATPVRVLVFAGSTRTGSYNKKLARLAAAEAGAAGAGATFVDLRDYPLPLYDGDLEEAEGVPEPARRLKQAMITADALIIAAPEYNSSIAGVLKNTLDWVSRQETDDEPARAAFDGKVVALLSASPGALGGMRGLMILRLMLSNIGAVVLPDQLSISRAHDAFDDRDQLKDPRRQQSLKEVVARLIAVAGALRP